MLFDWIFSANYANEEKYNCDNEKDVNKSTEDMKSQKSE